MTRTDDELVRYHGKLILIDRVTLYVLGFNFTSNDVKSRSFGVRTKNPKVLRDVLALLEADRTRGEFKPSAPDLVVSPQNARRRLTRFLRKARVSLDIYDPSVTDDGLIRVMKELAVKGVAIGSSVSSKRSGRETTSTRARSRSLARARDRSRRPARLRRQPEPAQAGARRAP